MIGKDEIERRLLRFDVCDDDVGGSDDGDDDLDGQLISTILDIIPSFETHRFEWPQLLNSWIVPRDSVFPDFLPLFSLLALLLANGVDAAKVNVRHRVRAFVRWRLR